MTASLFLVPVPAMGTAGDTPQVLSSPEVTSIWGAVVEGEESLSGCPLLEIPTIRLLCHPDLFSFQHFDGLPVPLWSPLAS